MKQLNRTVELKTSVFKKKLQISACMTLLPLVEVKQNFHFEMPL